MAITPLIRNPYPCEHDQEQDQKEDRVSTLRHRPGFFNIQDKLKIIRRVNELLEGLGASSYRKELEYRQTEYHHASDNGETGMPIAKLSEMAAAVLVMERNPALADPQQVPDGVSRHFVEVESRLLYTKHLSTQATHVVRWLVDTPYFTKYMYLPRYRTWEPGSDEQRRKDLCKQLSESKQAVGLELAPSGYERNRLSLAVKVDGFSCLLGLAAPGWVVDQGNTECTVFPLTPLANEFLNAIEEQKSLLPPPCSDLANEDFVLMTPTKLQQLLTTGETYFSLSGDRMPGGIRLMTPDEMAELGPISEE